METIKNLVYAGVGLASTANDKIRSSINDLVEKGKISDTEGKKIIDDIFKTTESTKEDIENKVKSISEKITSKFDFPKKDNSVVESLEAKIADLEKQLADVKKTAAKNTTSRKPATKRTTTAKKTTSRKSTTTK